MLAKPNNAKKSASTIGNSIPTDTPKLMKYCEIVRDIAAKPGDWLYYDEQFRFIRQSAPANTHGTLFTGNFG